MSDEEQFEEMVQRISKKNIVVKCNPFYFRVFYKGEFENNPQYSSVDSIKDKIDNTVTRIITNGKGGLYTIGQQTVIKLNENSDAFSKEIIEDLFTLKAGSKLEFDYNKSLFEITFSLPQDHLIWKAQYHLLSIEYLCLSMSYLDDKPNVFYVDTDSGIKTLLSFNHLAFSRFSK